MTHPTQTVRGADLLQRYAEVRARLWNRPPPSPAQNNRRVIPVVPQPHRPDFVEPEPPLPMVRINQAAKERVRDILAIAQTERPQGVRWLVLELDEIIAQVMTKHGVARAELFSAQRSRRIVAARHEVFYRLSKETTLSLPQIGRKIGGKDHTTVLHGIRRHEAKLAGEQYRPGYRSHAEAAAP